MMKMKILLCSALFMFILFSGCEKKEKPSKVQENGLTKEINDLVPKEILDAMINLGMPINGGENPPDLENIYMVSPFILLNSNVPGDFPGQSFANYQVRFYNQDNDHLSINIDYINGPESGNGLGSYIVGDNCKFSVFVEIEAMHTNGTKANFIQVISGTFAEDGIENIYVANFMLDDYGDPTDIWIGIGEGRVLYDQDGFSEILGTTRSWYSNLPPCPCTYAEVKNLGKTACPAGEWFDCEEISTAFGDFHYGAKYEVRWAPEGSDSPGQQCTYDKNGKLITSGIGAGSPDRDSPDGCSSLDFGHIEKDVDTWKEQPCWIYLRDWPSNNKLACSPNPVADIQHMLAMVGQMTCEEVTELFYIVDNSGHASNELKDYFHARLGYTPANLKSQLQLIYNALDCNSNLDESNCKALKKAIDNL